jgi:hypothetical protein
MDCVINQLLAIAGYAAFSWVLVSFEPLLRFREKYLAVSTNIFLQLIYKLISCSKCFAFWFTLTYTHNLFIASLTSLIAVIMTKQINGMPTRV